MTFALPALAGASLLALAAATSSYAQTGSSEVIWGPYNADFPAAGDGLTKDVKQGAISGTNVTLSGWVKPSETVKGRAPVAGTASGELALIDGRLAFTSPAGDVTSARALYGELLRAHERVYGPDHPKTAALRADSRRWTQ